MKLKVISSPNNIYKGLIIALSLLLRGNSACASVPDTIFIEDVPLLYHKLPTNIAEKKGLIIYMHGGVSQFKEPEQPIAPEPEELLEGNNDFIPSMQKAGYDIIMPIAYKQYNWLEDKGEEFINNILVKHASAYQQVIISGFSDGGTGAFRFFYNAPEKYDGVIIFNGYPQLQNYYKKVDHYKATGKKIIYCSTLSDKVIPYEFLLVEFRRQQMLNERTYFILKEGGHAFTAYTMGDFEECAVLLNKKEQHQPAAGKIMIFPPIDGLVIDGSLKHLYPFRKKTGKSYSMSAQEYARGDFDYKRYAKLLQSGGIIKAQPIMITKEALKEVKQLEFTLEENGKEVKISLVNWLNTPTW